MVEVICALFSLVGTVVTAWFVYNQKKHNQQSEMELQQWKKKEDAKARRRNDNSAIVYGEIWRVLNEVGADRVYIVQPHPLGNEAMVSVYYEAKCKGVESMLTKVQNIKMSDIGKFCAELASNKFLAITDIDEQVNDRYAKAILSAYGTSSALVRRLSDNRYDWVGSIFCEFTHTKTLDIEAAKHILDDAASTIQFILPEFRN